MIFIDESGDLGCNGSRYFVIAAVEIDRPKRLKNLAKHFCASRGIDEIKGTNLRFPERQMLINGVSRQNDYKVHYLVLDKQGMLNKHPFGQNIIFNYLTALVCESIIKNASGEIRFCFDNREVRTDSKQSLPDYLKAKAIEWHITQNINVSFHNSCENRGVQIADLVANTIFRKYERGKDDLYNMLNIKKSTKIVFHSSGIIPDLTDRTG